MRILRSFKLLALAILAAAGQLPAAAIDSASPPPAASADVQKLRDEIQLNAMQEVADKISLVASDLYTEANKGNPQSGSLDHPQKQVEKLMPAGVSSSINLTWSSDTKPSNEWMGVFVSELSSWFPLFADEMSAIFIPQDKEAAISEDWADIVSKLKQAEAQHQQLKTLVKTNPPNAPAIADLTRQLYYNMQAVKDRTNDVYQVLASTNPAREDMPSTWKQVAGYQSADKAEPGAGLNANGAEESNRTLTGHVIAANIGLKDIHEAAVKMQRTSQDMINELERWNFLWGQPPADNRNSGMLWGGGLTKEEVLSEYRYLPMTVFTMPNYVRYFSYRLPPRKKYLLVYTRQLGMQINMLSKALEQTELPEDKVAEVSPQWTEIQTLSKDLAARYINLMNLVVNTSDDRLSKSIRADQLTFGEPVAAIYKDVQSMGSLVKQMHDELKKPGKSSTKAT